MLFNLAFQMKWKYFIITFFLQNIMIYYKSFKNQIDVYCRLPKIKRGWGVGSKLKNKEQEKGPEEVVVGGRSDTRY